MNEEHDRFFAWLFDGKYQPSQFHYGFDSLKGHDQIIAKYLDMANQMLPEDEQYFFYMAKYDRLAADPGYELCGRRTRKF